MTPALTPSRATPVRELAPAKKTWIPIAAAVVVLVGGFSAYRMTSGTKTPALSDSARAAPSGVLFAAESAAKGSVPVDSSGARESRAVANSVSAAPAAVQAKAVSARDSGAKVAVVPKIVDQTVDEPAPGSALDSLSALLVSADASRARSIASALRELAPRLKSPGSRARAYFRLIDASVSAGDLSGACTALGNAKRSARPSQAGEVKRYASDLGCE